MQIYHSYFCTSFIIANSNPWQPTKCSESPWKVGELKFPIQGAQIATSPAWIKYSLSTSSLVKLVMTHSAIQMMARMGHPLFHDLPFLLES